jgi:Ran GTPase-activating protein (RanGAP) involved in mRNA processing and transport
MLSKELQRGGNTLCHEAARAVKKLVGLNSDLISATFSEMYQKAE